MGLYSKYILPRAIHFACKQKPTTYQRRKIVPLAEGAVLELGIGSGLNLSHYEPDKVTSIVGIDPEPRVWDRRDMDESAFSFPVEFVQAYAEKLPFEANSFDSAVVTYTLCSIPEIETAFSELRRVLKPNGRLFFSEHGIAPDASVRRWQYGVEPVWSLFSGGCRLTRNIPKLIAEGGFYFETLEEMYIPGWKPGSYNYWGVARQNT